jgi:ethanolamine ammonia-lyase large subunit
MGVPGSDDIMLNYQTTSFHDALYARRVLGLRPAPEFETWLKNMSIFAGETRVTLSDDIPVSFSDIIQRLR